MLSNNPPLASSLPITRLLRRLARAQHVPRHQVADLVQDVWLRMLTHFPQASDQPLTAPLTAWMQRSVHNLAEDWRRREQRRQTLCTSALVEAILDGNPDADPAHHLDRNLDHELVDHFLHRLHQEVSAENYHLFWLHWIEEQPVAELATAVHLDPAVISSRLSCMLKRVQSYAAPNRSEYGIRRPRKIKD
jgi:RNA polymerase sigma factor (sigma-70 family)